jgi:aryl-alcohol dehydrogenase-like predicted oxidoreductase
VEHLEENVSAAAVKLTEEDFEQLSGVPELVASR